MLNKRFSFGIMKNNEAFLFNIYFHRLYMYMIQLKFRFEVSTL